MIEKQVLIMVPLKFLLKIMDLHVLNKLIDFSPTTTVIIINHRQQMKVNLTFIVKNRDIVSHAMDMEELLQTIIAIFNNLMPLNIPI